MVRSRFFIDQPLVHELHRQPVEQFGMRRQFALDAEILRRPDEAAAEQLRPPAIHRHARGQRIVARDQPAREIEARARLASLARAGSPACPAARRRRGRCKRRA